MGSIYRKTAKDPGTGRRVDIGPYWIKFYRNGRPFRESTRVFDRKEATRKLKEREGEIAKGQFRGLAVERTKFEDLVEDLKTHYRMDKTGALGRLGQALAHLNPVFHGLRAIEITSRLVQGYITRRQDQGAANGTINRETGMIKRMFALALQQTPPKVALAPYIPHLTENIREGYFEHEDFLALRGALPDYAQVAVSLAYYSGMRLGEVFSLQWEQVNVAEGRLALKAKDTKNKTPRVLYLDSDLSRVLTAWKQRSMASWPQCPWICHRKGRQLKDIKSAWKRGCQVVGLGQMVMDEEKGRKVWQGKIPHDFRRTAVRNTVKAGVPEKVAMLISGHKTRSVFQRYQIMDEDDLKVAATRVSAYFSKQMGTISGTIAQLGEPELDVAGVKGADS